MFDVVPNRNMFPQPSPEFRKGGGAGRAINASNLGKVRLSAGQRTN